MADPTITNEENLSLLWKLTAGLSTILLGIIGWIWKSQVDTTKDHEERIVSLEASQINREEFNNAMSASRNELKSEMKEVIHETHASRDSLQKSISASNHELTTRLDNFMAMWATNHTRRTGD